MNIRLQELINQSKRLPYEHNVSLESFAELIVRECAEIADTAEPYKASDLIKKHFKFE